MDVRQRDDELRGSVLAAQSVESSAATGRRHVSQHDCSTCRRTFASRRNLVRHQLTHSGEKPFSCAHCGILFTQACSLRRHELLHADDSRWSCCQCGRSFAAANLLAIHLLKDHGNGRPGSTANISCEQSLSRRSGTVRRLLLPPGECRPRIGTAMQQQATGDYGPATLVSQAARLRRASAACAAGRPRCACHACNKVLADVHSLKRHLLACHMRLRPHECVGCGQCFSRQEHLKKHQQRSIACCVSSVNSCSSAPSSPATSEELGLTAPPVAGEAAPAAAGLSNRTSHCPTAEDVDDVPLSANGLLHAVLPQVVVHSSSLSTRAGQEERDCPSDPGSPKGNRYKPVALQSSATTLSPKCGAEQLRSVALQLDYRANAGHCRDGSSAEESEVKEKQPAADGCCSADECFDHTSLPEDRRSGERIACFLRSASDEASSAGWPLPLSRLSGSSERQWFSTEVLATLTAGSHPCDRCHRTFSSAGYLRVHELTSHGEAERSAAKEHVCDRCGSCFSGSGSLKRHALRHLGAKPHACRMCSRAFTQASCLKRHVLACHVRAKPHECSRCGRCFSRLENLRLHQRSKMACKYARGDDVGGRHCDRTAVRESCDRTALPIIRESFEGRNGAPADTAIRVNGSCRSDDGRPEDFSGSRMVRDVEQQGSDSDAESYSSSSASNSCSHVQPFNLHSDAIPAAATTDGDSGDRPTVHTDVAVVGLRPAANAEGSNQRECGFTEMKKERRPLLAGRRGASKHSSDLLGGETSSSFSDESLPALTGPSTPARSESSSSQNARSVNDEPSIGGVDRNGSGDGDTPRTLPPPTSSFAADHQHVAAAARPSDGSGRPHNSLTAPAADYPRHACETCGRTFSTAVHLRRHRRTHTGEKPFLCDLCGRQFSQSDGLRRHARLHTGERPHQCTSCGRRFARPWNLKVHELIHNPSQKPHACGLCGSTFVRQSRLTKHVASCLFGRQLAAEPMSSLGSRCPPELVAEQRGSNELVT